MVQERYLDNMEVLYRLSLQGGQMQAYDLLGLQVVPTIVRYTRALLEGPCIVSCHAYCRVYVRRLSDSHRATVSAGGVTRKVLGNTLCTDLHARCVSQ
jgi:hypothetical protein